MLTDNCVCARCIYNTDLIQKIHWRCKNVQMIINDLAILIFPVA